MTQNLIATTTTAIGASTGEVWKAITTPALISQYLMGTTVKSNFTEGSPISYEGEYEGKAYHDKGVIKRYEPGKVFASTYWSSMSGKEDRPENYNLVTYTLSELGGKTVVTLTQDNVRTEKEKDQVVENWKAVLKQLKDLVEKRAVPQEEGSKAF